MLHIMMVNGKTVYLMEVVVLSMMMAQSIRVALNKDLLSAEMLYLLNKMGLTTKVK